MPRGIRSGRLAWHYLLAPRGRPCGYNHLKNVQLENVEFIQIGDSRLGLQVVENLQETNNHAEKTLL